MQVGDYTRLGEIVAISPDGNIRAVYDRFGLGLKGQLQRQLPNGKWKTFTYIEEYSNLMTEFYRLMTWRDRACKPQH